jgi:hypothetical protein
MVSFRVTSVFVAQRFQRSAGDEGFHLGILAKGDL